MQPSWRILFLIVAAGTALHLSAWGTALVCCEYSILELLDRSIQRKARQRALNAVNEEEIYGWTPTQRK
jgi:hypothetical protein